MHRAAFAAAQAGGLAQQLSHHQVRVRPLGQRQTVAAISAKRQVVRLQRRDHTQRGGLLGNIGVGRAAIAALAIKLDGLLVKEPHQPHAAQHFELLFVR